MANVDILSLEFINDPLGALAGSVYERQADGHALVQGGSAILDAYNSHQDETGGYLNDLVEAEASGWAKLDWDAYQVERDRFSFLLY